jgi:hypothetical protein
MNIINPAIVGSFMNPIVSLGVDTQLALWCIKRIKPAKNML